MASCRSENNLPAKYSGSVIEMIAHRFLFEKMIFDGDDVNSTRDNSEYQNYKMNILRYVRELLEYDNHDNLPRKILNSRRHERCVSVNAGVIC